MSVMQDDDLALVLRAMGHPVRLNILRILSQAQNQCCCADVLQHLPLAQSTVSQHIKVLMDAGLIERSPVGTRNCYTVRSQRVAQLQTAFQSLAGVIAAPVCIQSLAAEPA
jgi:ArsR family transcriptional regulator, arsenate/arsenite/antimonite-responsive transcriptional repressor